MVRSVATSARLTTPRPAVKQYWSKSIRKLWFHEILVRPGEGRLLENATSGCSIGIAFASVNLRLTKLGEVNACASPVFPPGGPPSPDKT